MQIRPARQSDIPGILSLLLQVGDVHHRLRPDIFREGAQKYNENQLLALLQDPDRPIYVAELPGAVAGYAFCIRKEAPDNGVMKPRQELYVDDLCVDVHCRGQGIATALYRHVCEKARALGCQFVTLNVWCGNESAMRFYEKCGLRPRNIMMEMPLEEPHADKEPNL